MFLSRGMNVRILVPLYEYTSTGPEKIVQPLRTKSPGLSFNNAFTQLLSQSSESTAEE